MWESKDQLLRRKNLGDDNNASYVTDYINHNMWAPLRQGTLSKCSMKSLRSSKKIKLYQTHSLIIQGHLFASENVNQKFRTMHED
jgi:hypothetical protein